jgi:hypothetical protein
MDSRLRGNDGGGSVTAEADLTNPGKCGISAPNRHGRRRQSRIECEGEVMTEALYLAQIAIIILVLVELLVKEQFAVGRVRA